MIPYEQLCEALARWRAERRAVEAGGDAAPPSNGQPDGTTSPEIEADEVIEPEPD